MGPLRKPAGSRQAGFSITLRKPRRVALPCRIVSLGPLAALLALHLGRQLVERPRTQHRYFLPDHLERHPHRTLAALASDPRIALGLKLGDGAGVGHGRIKAWSDTLGNDPIGWARARRRHHLKRKSRPEAALNSNLMIDDQAAINDGFDLRR